MNVKLDPGVADYVRAKVSRGSFASETECVNAALRLWMENEESIAHDALKRAILAGLNDLENGNSTSFGAGCKMSNAAHQDLQALPEGEAAGAIAAAIESLPSVAAKPCSELAFGVCALNVGDYTVYYRPRSKGGVMIARVLQRAS